ncbi:polysaccharide lyase family 7 protein [Croceivirga sp. JEA036]|uniref:polysaccharide lyase family 7 protein n=1 Tax=Croceivirga sp. JEA036 TaxID=2721162 RepID=UPI00143CBB46|nr:polysaccharide lyase family 7 protein [Croceivirga sp. JEA036]NJB37692.1 polysaccharide lyase family 7 protein [Croceivirga sp. JEA036]
MYNFCSKSNNNYNLYLVLSLLLTVLISCSDKQGEEEVVAKEQPNVEAEEEGTVQEDATANYTLPTIDLNHWKVTLPIGNNGKPIEVEPPEILDYATNETLLPYMYNDSTDGSLVFYTFPEVSTANSTYSRTELREQMVPGSNSTNWTFEQGGELSGTLSVPEVSLDQDGNPYRIIVMQIHGRLTNEQRDLIGEDDNNAPPVLKIYWAKNKVRVHTKMLKDTTLSDTEILYTTAWKDSVREFSEVVGTAKFNLTVKASKNKLEVSLNNAETFVYEDVHMRRWGIFENYFKAGNYFVSKVEGTNATVKYYQLKIDH